MKIALVRHGETDWNKANLIQGQSDVPLNQTGLLQAGKTANWLAHNGPWDVLYSSELTRARQTAEIISNGLNLGLNICEALAERRFGALEGLTAAEREERYPRRLEDETSVPGLELRRDFRERVVTAFETLVHETAGLNLIIVAHGGWINQLLFHLSNGVIGSGITTVKNGGVYLVSRSEDNWDLHEIAIE